MSPKPDIKQGYRKDTITNDFVITSAADYYKFRFYLLQDNENDYKYKDILATDTSVLRQDFYTKKSYQCSHVCIMQDIPRHHTPFDVMKFRQVYIYLKTVLK